MTIPVTTRAVKGSPLTTVEMDSNLDGLARDATEIQQGNVQFATEAQTEALTADDLAISPLNLPFGISEYADSLASSFTTPSGYFTLPNGIIVQWTSDRFGDILPGANFSMDFPIPFPNACLHCSVTPSDPSGSAIWLYLVSFNTTTVTMDAQEAASTVNFITAYALAIGH